MTAFITARACEPGSRVCAEQHRGRTRMCSCRCSGTGEQEYPCAPVVHVGAGNRPHQGTLHQHVAHLLTTAHNAFTRTSEADTSRQLTNRHDRTRHSCVCPQQVANLLLLSECGSQFVVVRAKACSYVLCWYCSCCSPPSEAEAAAPAAAVVGRGKKSKSHSSACNSTSHSHQKTHARARDRTAVPRAL